MTDQTAYDEAMAIFDDLYREQMYVEREGQWVTLEFKSDGDSHELHVNLWTGKVVLVNAETNETVICHD